jgi:anti-sigma-K factor RskA
MNEKTGGSRGWRRAGALAAAAAVAVLTAACGVHASLGGDSASAGPATYRENLAYGRCMRAHGLPNFPIPNPSEGNGLPNVPMPKPSVGLHIRISRQLNPNSPAARANDACQHLLARGSEGMAGATAAAASRPLR